MRVYLIAAPEDQEEAEKLAEYLKRFGVFIRSEFGQMAYPPAHHGEYTLALWSRNAMISSRQMMITNRAIDAWEDGHLVMARLEHGLNPRGLADLEMVDLKFPSAREHRYHDVLNAIRALEDQRRAQAREMTSTRSAADSGPVNMQGDMEAVEDTLEDIRQPMKSAAPDLSVERKSSGGGCLGGFLAICVVALLATGVAYGPSLWLTYGPSDVANEMLQQFSAWVQSDWTIPAAMIGAPIGILLVILIFRAMLRGGSKRISSDADELEIDSFTAAPRASVPAPTMSVEAALEATQTPEIFVSYSHENSATVFPIVDSVESEGVSVWIDRDEMRAGQNWAGQIVRAIKASGRFCLMCSAQSYDSNNVRREVYLANKYEKAMVPILLDGAKMPDDIEFFLVDTQWLDLTKLDENERSAAIKELLVESEN